MKKEKKIEIDEFIIHSMKSCPYGADNDSCMFSVLRSYSERDKLRWFDQLNPYEKKQIYLIHQHCSMIKKNKTTESKKHIVY